MDDPQESKTYSNSSYIILLLTSSLFIIILGAINKLNFVVFWLSSFISHT